MDKRFMGILGALAIIFIGIFVISQNSSSNSSNNSSKNSTAGVTHNVMGQGKSGVTFQEYGDYQCPICEAYYLPVKQAVDQVTADIYFQFSNLPLSPSPHPNAFAAARAAQAAALQNKFWQMHDKLYEAQNEWAGESNPQTLFNNYAQQLSLNVEQFKQDYASTKVNDMINADLDAFAKTGKEKATPTFFINGKYIPNSSFTDAQTGRPSVEQIAKVLKDEISKKSSSSSNQ